ncbi:MAG: hypothetical protein LH477_15840 [Nocardioides sp.]|nr:hypothetical protein [Nocardioides sp.]
MTTETKIATMEDQLARLQETQSDLRQELARARVDQWRGRIEDLEVQVHLAAMDSNECLDQLTEQLRNTWDRAQVQLDDATSTASVVAATLLSGLETAYRDVREALLESRSRISH